MKFIRAIPREYTATDGGVSTRSVIAPMALTLRPVVSKRGLFSGGGSEASEPDVRQHSRGTLEVYVCVACGFLEWYCQDPESIPIGPEYMTEAIDYGGRTPYR